LLEEQPCRLVPPRIERSPARGVRKLEVRRNPRRRQELESRFESLPDLGRNIDANREIGIRRSTRVFELRVEEPLVPEQIRVYRQRGTVQVSECSRIAGKGAIGEQRDAVGAYRRVESTAILGQLDLLSRRSSSLFELVVDVGEVEIADASLRQGKAGQKHEWHPEQQSDASVFGFDKSLQNDFLRQVGAIGEYVASERDDRQQADRLHATSKR